MEEILKQLTDYQVQIHNKVTSAEGMLANIKGTQLEKELSASLDYFKAVTARLAVCIDILEGRAFVLYQEEGSKDLIVARPNESTAKLIKKAEELGARLTEFTDLGKQQALI